MFRFTIRELVLLTVIVAMGAGWLDQRTKLQSAESRSKQSHERLEWLADRLLEKGYRADFESDPFGACFIEPNTTSPKPGSTDNRPRQKASPLP